MNQLINLRKKIDELDSDLLTLLFKRFQIVSEIGTYKKSQGLGVIDKKREEKIIRILTKKAKEYNISDTCIKKVWEAIIEESYKKE